MLTELMSATLPLSEYIFKQTVILFSLYVLVGWVQDGKVWCLVPAWLWLHAVADEHSVRVILTFNPQTSQLFHKSAA